MTVTSMEDLSEVVAAQVTAAQRVVLDSARAMANEVGIASARRTLTDALDGIRSAQETLRAATDKRKAAAEQLEQRIRQERLAVAFDRVVKEGNKTFWLTDDDETEMVEGPDGARPQPTGRKARRQVTADQAVELAEAEADRSLVVERQQLEECDQELAAARDALSLAEKRFQAARADVQAASVQLQVLALALPHAEESR